ncbi:MAG: Lrp/AsnC family transcriptional regulator [Candidatus Thorarchaeota archaeon]
MQLDNIDKQILNALFKNGRESLTSLEKIIIKSDTETMSHTGIAKRITKLEDNDLIKIQANTNLNKLQYKGLFLLMEMVNFEEVQNIIKAYSDCPRVFLMAPITGQYNLILGVIGQNLDILHRYLNYCGPTNKKGILHSAVMFTTDLIKPKYVPINLFSQESHEKDCGNICKDCAAYLDGKCNGCGNF